MAGYIGSRAVVATSGVERKKTFAITTTTTSLTGLDYTPNHVHVFHNGIRLVDGTDYTATNGTSITLVNAAENGDEVVVVSYGTFSPADTYTKSETYTKTEADDRYVNAAGDTMTGALALPAGGLNVGYGQLSVDASGRVTMPYQPAFAVVGNTATFVGLNVAGTVQLNVGGHFNNTLGRFTAPVSGNYLFTFSLTTGDAQKHFIDIGLNGSAALGVVGGLHLSYDTTYQNGSVTTVYPLSAGDFVEAKRRGTDYAVYRATFSGYLIG